MLWLATGHGRAREQRRKTHDRCPPEGDPTMKSPTPNLPTDMVGFKGFDSSIILIERGGILRFIGDFLESLTQAMLVGTMLVGRLCVEVTSGSPKSGIFPGSPFSDPHLGDGDTQNKDEQTTSAQKENTLLVASNETQANTIRNIGPICQAIRLCD